MSAVNGFSAPFAALATTVVAFTGGWARGALVIDGPGIAIYVRLALRYLLADGRVPYWLPDMWAGAPVWAIGPSFPAFILLPFAAVIGPEGAVKAGILGFQVAGAWGAFVLVRSLWRSTPAALVAGVVYGISPLVVLNAALIGNENAMGVIAAAPWLTWALRHGIRGRGTRYLVVAGAVAAFALLHQAEYAYGLALLGFFQVVGEIGRSHRRAEGAATVGRILSRTALAVVVCLGLVAYWILPFLSLSKYFVLSPLELVQGELYQGVGRLVANDLGLFLRRLGGLHGVVSVYRANVASYAFYMGTVPVAVTCLSALLVARRRGDRTFTGILLATVGGVWLSTGAVALARGGPVLRGQFLPMILLGLLVGAVIGGFVRRLRLGWARMPVLAAALVLLATAPYLTPFLTLQRLVPLLDSVRLPRFYVVAVLALALGTAWPVAHIGDWLPSSLARWRRLAPVLLAGVLAGAVVADSWPYRSFYSVHPPSSAAAYGRVDAAMAAIPPGARIAGSTNPISVGILIRKGMQLSTGWPHPVAYGPLWRLTIGALMDPPRYGRAALALSSTAYVIGETGADVATAHESVADVILSPVPQPLPRVRAYDRTLSLGDAAISPELAAGLASKNVGVVSGSGQLPALQTISMGEVPTGSSCRATSATADLSAGAAGEIAAACGLRGFLYLTPAGAALLGPETTPGASFTALTDGLQGISVWMEGMIGSGELVLKDLEPDGRPGPEVARSKVTSVDQYGMAVFGFAPIPASAGKRYVFDIECPDCYSEREPQIYAPRNVYGKGNLTTNGRLNPDYSLAFTPAYERMEPQPPSQTSVTVDGSGPGHWKLTSSGPAASLVVVADANFPGWTARVDGHRAPVLEADGAFISVAVGPGQHRITFDYGPGVAALVGRLITFATILALLAGGLLSRRRRLRHALEMGAPAVEGAREPALRPGEEHPGPAVAGGQSPGAEGDQAVLAAGDHGEAGVAQHPE